MNAKPTAWRIEYDGRAPFGFGYFVSYTDGDPSSPLALWWARDYTFTLWGARRAMRRFAGAPRVIEQVVVG